MNGPKGRLLYVFGGCLKIYEMSNSIKACLISIGPPELAAKLKCYMKLMCHGKGIFHKLRRQDFDRLPVVPLCLQVYSIKVNFYSIVHN